MKTKIIGALAALSIGLGVSLSAAASDTVLRVLVVEPSDVTAYAHEVETAAALYKKAGIPITLRVWRATYAGPNTGTIVVGIEPPSLATLAKMPEILMTNPELAAEMRKIGAMRKVVSDSLYEPLTD